MSDNIGVSGADYNTQIPKLSENANIQDAFKVYHYGDTTDAAALNPLENSMAYFLGQLESTKIGTNPVNVSYYLNNLNSIVTTGYYIQPNSTGTTGAQASGAIGYPTYPQTNGLAYAGLLEVTRSSVLVFQKYHMADSKNIVFWRTSNDSGLNWSPWKQATDETHNHNDYYYLKQETYSATQTDNKLAVKPTSNLSGQKIFILPPETGNTSIPQGNPTANDGDLWFW